MVAEPSEKNRGLLEARICVTDARSPRKKEFADDRSSRRKPQPRGFRSRESEAATESLRGIHAREIRDGNPGRIPVSVSIVRVAMNSFQKAVRVVERNG